MAKLTYITDPEVVIERMKRGEELIRLENGSVRLSKSKYTEVVHLDVIDLLVRQGILINRPADVYYLAKK